MAKDNGIDTLQPRLRLLFCLVLFEYLMFIFSGVSYSFLYKDPFFMLEADPFSWIIYGLHIPQFLIGHYWLGFCLDVVNIVLLLLIILKPLNHRIALALFALLFIFYVTLMGYLTHRNYQVGFFMVFVPFIFKKQVNKKFAFEAIRYFLLFFYFSAAVIKLWNGSLSDPGHFSHMISAQFAPYFLEGNVGLRTGLNLFIINHVQTGYALYIASFAIEMMAVVGFFTKRYDAGLAILFIAFHLMSWLIMDIAPIGQLGFISVLFLSKQLGTGN